MAARATGRVPALDGVRGIAIFLVLGWHYFFNGINTNGVSDATLRQILETVRALTSLWWSGVDLFFVLSGFLLGGILIARRRDQNFFLTFYVRRAARILPLYFMVLALTLLIAKSAWTQQHAVIKYCFTSNFPSWSYAIFAQNFFMSARSSFGMPALAPTWSLAVEEHFYLFLPLIIYFTPPRKIPLVCWTLILSAMACRFIITARFPQYYYAFNTQLPCRMDSLAMGIFGAWLATQESFWRWRTRRPAALWVILVALSVATACLGKFTINKGRTGTIFPALAALYLVLILFAISKPNLIQRVLSTAWLRGLGRISFCVYLIHFPVLFICHDLVRHQIILVGGWRDILTSLLALAVTIALAAISWRMFERPILGIGHRMSYGSPRDGKANANLSPPDRNISAPPVCTSRDGPVLTALD
jgi:peptidoglycan/LPS O-acetylase OafA/YrhL